MPKFLHDGHFSGSTIDLTVDGSISNSSGHFTISSADDFNIDAAGQINLDADGGNIRLKDAGSQFGLIANSSQHLQIWASTDNKDILFKGYDGGTAITALQLDMSSNGRAFFSGKGVFNEGKVEINKDDDGTAPALTSTLHIKGFEGRGAGIRIQDSVNSASNASSREWFIGSGYGQSIFNLSLIHI